MMQGGDKTMVGGVTQGGAPGKLPHDLFVSIEVVSGPAQGAKFSIAKTHTMMGRSQGDVQIRDPTVSGRHASLEYVGSEFMIVDQQSSNGTYVNGEKVDKAKLNNMDEIKLGDCKIYISIVRDIYGTYSHQTGAQEEVDLHEFDPNAITVPRRPHANPDLPAELKIMLLVVEGPDAGKKFKLTRASTILGRADYADIQIQDAAISRRHCQILIRSREFMGLKDLASTNSTFLNGRRVSAVQLSHNDIIAIGDSKIKFVVL